KRWAIHFKVTVVWERTVITTGQLPQRDSIVADAVLLDYFSPLIPCTKAVPAIPQIQSYRNVTTLGLLLHRRRAYLSAIAHTLFAFSPNLVRRLHLVMHALQISSTWRWSVPQHPPNTFSCFSLLRSSWCWRPNCTGSPSSSSVLSLSSAWLWIEALALTPRILPSQGPP